MHRLASPPREGNLLVTGLSIFDLDETLLKGNSSFLFGRFLYRHHHIGLSKVIYALWIYFRHKVCGLHLKELHTRLFGLLFLGRAAQEIEQAASDFIQQHLISLLDPLILGELRSAQARGEKTLLLSSSPTFLVERIASLLGFNGWKGTNYLSDKEGRLERCEDPFDGPAKVSFAISYAAHLPENERFISAFSDSIHDLSLLELAGRPSAVRPCKKLKKIALLRSWAILG